MRQASLPRRHEGASSGIAGSKRRLPLAHLGSIASGSATYAYDTRGRMVQSGNTAYHYDNWGKLIAESSPAGVVRRELIYLGDIPVGVVQ